MRLFEKQEPGVQITPLFQYEGGLESFLKEESDILFALKEQNRQFPGVKAHDLFESRIRSVIGRLAALYIARFTVIPVRKADNMTKAR